MLTHKVDIERPVSLAVLIVVVVAGFAWAQLALMRMTLAQEQGPTLIVRHRDALVEALEAAPFARIATDEGALLNDPVWFVGEVGCEGCDAVTARALRAVEGAGLEPQIMFAPDTFPAPPETAVLVAVVARTGNADHFMALRRGAPLPRLIEDAAEAEGYGELARQSAERVGQVLAANGLPHDPPWLIWRDAGGDWRAMPATHGHAGAAARRDLQS